MDCPFWKFNTVSKIRLFDEVVPSPSIAGNAEQQVNKASKGKQVVGDNEVLQVLNGASCAKRLKTAPYIESKHAWHGQNENGDTVYSNGFFTAPSPQIHGKA